jgi:lipid-binding SYLF domain-containing protein
MLKEAYGFAVFPGVLKIGIGVTQIQGHGVMIFRNSAGKWQAPLPLLVSGTGLGPHFGLIAYDTLIPIKEFVDMPKLFEQGITFSGKDNIGPLQTWDSKNSGLVAYTRAKGISSGASQDTIHITLDQQAIAALYGIHVEPHELFSGKLEGCRKPLPAQKLIEKANELATGAPLTTILEEKH